MSEQTSSVELDVKYVSTIKGTNEVVNGCCVHVMHEGEWLVIAKSKGIALKFGSKRDCEMAMKALVDNGIRNADDLRRIKSSGVVKICCEALLW